MITKPTLPPRKGYVEVEENGVRVYQPTAETQRKLREDAERQSQEDDAMALAVDHEYRLSLLEVGLSEEEI